MTTSHDILFLSAADVRVLLPVHDCINVMASAFVAMTERRATMPNRGSLSLGDDGESMLLMPATFRETIHDGAGGEGGHHGWFGAKVLSVIPQNASSGRDSIQGVIVLFERQYGSTVAVIDAGAVTAIRTAAVSAVATRLLARPDATRLALIGSGVQAVSHLAAMLAIRPLRELRVWSRNADRCAALAQAAEAEFGIDARVGSSARDAVENADIICTVTSASAPVIESAWIAPGTHINAVGAHRPTERELDSDTIRRASVFVDHLPAALAEAGDVLVPIAEGSVTRAHVRGDLSDLLCGRIIGRAADDDVTVFKSVGIAVTDIAAAAHAYEQAAAAGLGTTVRRT